jgi:hypothetical protein
MTLQKLLKIEDEMFTCFFNSFDGTARQKLYFEIKVNLRKFEEIWIPLDNRLKNFYNVEND